MAAQTFADVLQEPAVQRSPVQRAFRMIFSRLVLFLLFQSILAGLFALSGRPGAWMASAAWWPVIAGLSNLVNLWLQNRALKLEGSSYRRMVRFEKPVSRKDIPLLVVLFILAGPICMLPNTWLATALFGSPEGPLAYFLQPLPMWGLVLGFTLFPLTNGLTELSNYYGYAMPRLEAAYKKPWLAVLLTASVHSAQHVFLPLVFEPRFILWRLLMFLPFALFSALMVRWRPRLLPYMMIVHALIDLTILPLYFI